MKQRRRIGRRLHLLSWGRKSVQGINVGRFWELGRSRATKC
jgi:hypothetical protein